jgi:hypothetical protein
MGALLAAGRRPGIGILCTSLVGEDEVGGAVVGVAEDIDDAKYVARLEDGGGVDQDGIFDRDDVAILGKRKDEGELGPHVDRFILGAQRGEEGQGDEKKAKAIKHEGKFTRKRAGVNQRKNVFRQD